MKVKELIKVLSELDPDLNVYRHGYEGEIGRAHV